MKKVKKFLKTLLIILLILLIGYIGLTLWVNRDRLTTDKTQTEAISTDWLESEIASISEYATLEYRYTNMSQFKNDLDFYGWKLPLTNKSFLIKYDGSMKLGIDGQEIDINISGKDIIITLPPVKVLSHVIEEDSVEVFDQSHNIFNAIKIEDYTTFATDQKKSMENKAFQEGVYLDASKKVEEQIGGLLSSLPGIKENYTITFVTTPPVSPQSVSSTDEVSISTSSTSTTTEKAA